MFFSKLLFFVLVIKYIRSDEVTIGGIFDGPEDQEKAFRYAIDRVNKQLAEAESTQQLTPAVELVQPNTPFVSLNTTCNLLYNGALGIIGPKSIDNIMAVQAVCDETEMPHVTFRWNQKPLRTGTLINLYPHAGVLSRMYYDIISAFGWTTFTILYEDNESLIRLGDLIYTAKQDGIYVVVMQLDKFQTGNYRTTLKDAQKSGQHFFVIDCDIDRLKDVLTQAQQVGLITSEYHFFLTNLDSHTEDLTPFQYSETNITGIRLINPDKQYVQDISSELYSDGDNENVLFTGPLMAWKLRTEIALIIDAVEMYSKALLEILEASPRSAIPIECGTNSWEHGLSVINLMKTNNFDGLTGLINFDNEGYRSNFQLDLFELKEGGIINIGTWNSSTGLNITRVVTPVVDVDEDSLKNKTFIVITCLTDPYGMLKDAQEPLIGNDRFEGFGIDLIHELSVMEGFNYTFVIREDKKNGAKDLETGKWSGMIGDLMEYRADLAITDLTITSERAEAVDFTTPFMNLGISILFRKPEKAPPNFFSFAEPFAKDTWAMLGLGFVVVSLSMFVMGRLCADEWTNPYPCIEEPEYLVNQFSLQNSIWFSVGSLMCQGTEIAPIAISTRTVAAMWWFFGLIIIASYTANLAAFLATENPIELFKDVVSLVNNAEEYGLRYGAKAGGATVNFFRDSANPTYVKIAEHMKNSEEDMVTTNDAGVELAEKERYALFMESTSIQYVTQRHCNLMMYGKQLDEKGYGIAMRKNSPYRHKLSLAILKLQASGVVEDLKRKWWEERRGGGQCNGDSEAAEATPLDLMNVEGVFYVTVGGCVVSMLLVIVEFMINAYKISKARKMPLREVIRIEMQHYMNFDSNVKTVTGREEDSEENAEEDAKDETESSKVNEDSPNSLNGKRKLPKSSTDNLLSLSQSLDKLTEEA